MLDQVNLNEEAISKEEYKAKRDELLERLEVLQQDCHREGAGAIIVFDGWDAAGKGRSISDLTVNLDARITTTWTIQKPVGDEERKPFMERFWSRVGRQGTFTIFNHSWYSRATHLLLEGDQDKLEHRRNVEYGRPGDMCGVPYGGKVGKEADRLLESIQRFEKQFFDDGYTIIKFFLHISREEQKKRLKKLARNKATAWRVGEGDWKRNKHYDQLYRLVDMSLERTDADYAPWNVVSGMNSRNANLKILQTIIDQLEKGLQRRREFNSVDKEAAAEKSRTASAQGLESSFKLVSVPSLDDVTYDNVLSPEDYQEQLDKERDRLRKYSEAAYLKRIPVMVAYEGWDAAGKGGNIKRLARGLDARDYRVYPSAAPTPEELYHPFLWRYWTRLPKTGHFGIYDRTWYGRVLVERIEGLARAEEWQRAYDEINAFERDLQLWGAVLVKFWIDVSDAEQLRRFHERQDDPAKQWKITDEDWRNREKNPQYRVAVNDMLRLTSTEYAPWHIIESDDKRFARVKAMRIVNEALAKRLGKK